MGAVIGVQVSPPFVVRRSTAPVADAKPRVSFTKQRPTMALVVPLVCRVQLAPASVVRAILPLSLAAQPSVSFTKLRQAAWPKPKRSTEVALLQLSVVR
jgi:hypothetical protein